MTNKERIQTSNNVLINNNDSLQTVIDMVSSLPENSGVSSKYTPRYIAFYMCPYTELQEELNNIDTKNITNMQCMFDYCQYITSLDLSHFDTSKVTSMAYMFSSCKALTYLDIRSFDFSNVTAYEYMFHEVPTNCKIIVKDDDARNWVLARRSTLTNVQTLAEIEG